MTDATNTADLRAAAQAVIARWDTPLWKDAPATAEYIGRLRAALAAPAQAVPAPGVEAVSEREFKQFLSDVLTAAGLVTHGKKCKDLGRRLGEMSMRLLTAPKTAAVPAQAGEYPKLPDLYSTGAPFWRAVLAWHDAHHGPEAINAADKLDMLVADMLRAYVDADRAARGAAQAAPVDAAKLPSPANVGTAPECLNLNDQAMWALGWNECLDAARAAQGGT